MASSFIPVPVPVDRSPPPFDLYSVCYLGRFHIRRVPLAHAGRSLRRYIQGTTSDFLPESSLTIERNSVLGPQLWRSFAVRSRITIMEMTNNSMFRSVFRNNNIMIFLSTIKMIRSTVKSILHTYILHSSGHCCLWDFTGEFTSLWNPSAFLQGVVTHE